jgi:hypothetical protein
VIGSGAMLLALALLCGPPVSEVREQADRYELREPAGLRESGSQQSATSLSQRYERRARREFIASSVLFGVVSVAEKVTAGVALNCSIGEPCAISLTYAWGSQRAGTRYTLFTTGPASAYVATRTLAIPLVWVGQGLLLMSAHDRAIVDLARGESLPYSRRLAWSLFGSGLGLYLGSRLLRLGFALGGVCQAPGCVYSFDQLTLSASRGLAFTGSALLVYQRTQKNIRLGLTPFGALGLGLQGQF